MPWKVPRHKRKDRPNFLLAIRLDRHLPPPPQQGRSVRRAVPVDCAGENPAASLLAGLHKIGGPPAAIRTDHLKPGQRRGQWSSTIFSLLWTRSQNELEGLTSPSPRPREHASPVYSWLNFFLVPESSSFPQNSPHRPRVKNPSVHRE